MIQASSTHEEPVQPSQQPRLLGTLKADLKSALRFPEVIEVLFFVVVSFALCY